MIAQLDKMANMPTSTKAVLGVVAGGGLGVAAYHLFGATGLLVFTLGVALVGLILAGYRWLIQRAQKRRADRFGREMAQAGAVCSLDVRRVICEIRYIQVTQGM